MFRPRKQQPKINIFVNVDQPPSKRRRRLKGSWAGYCNRGFFGRLNEELIVELYSDTPSRSNIPPEIPLDKEVLMRDLIGAMKNRTTHLPFTHSSSANCDIKISGKACLIYERYTAPVAVPWTQV